MPVFRAANGANLTPLPGLQFARSHSHETNPDLRVTVATLARPEKLHPLITKPASCEARCCGPESVDFHSP